MVEAVSRIEFAVLKSGIPLGGVAFTKEATDSQVRKGYRLLGGFDVLWLKGAISQSRDWLAK